MRHLKNKLKLTSSYFLKNLCYYNSMHNDVNLHIPTPEIHPEITPDRSSSVNWPRNQMQKYDFSEGTDFNGGSQKRHGFKLALWTMTSALVDHSILLGMTCLFLLTGLIVLQSTSGGLLTQHQLLNMGLGVYLLLAVSYFVLLRLFIGATIGEYSCGIRVGKPSERMKQTYFLKIFIRILIISCTGFIMLPVLSILFRKDFAGRISGLSIYSLK